MNGSSGTPVEFVPRPAIHSFDFDSFIAINDTKNWREILGLHPMAKQWIHFIQKEVGDYTILQTCRENEDLRAAIGYLALYGIEFPTVNDNAPFMIKLFNNNPRKIYADYYWDDHRGCRCGWEAVRDVAMKRYMEVHGHPWVNREE